MTHSIHSSTYTTLRSSCPFAAPKAFSRAMRTSPHPFSLCFIGPGAFFAPLPQGPLLVVYVVTHAPASCLLPILNHK